MRCAPSTGFTDELALPGAVGVCAPVPADTAHGIQHLCRVGLRHGGVQDVLPAQSHQTPGLLLQLHGGGCLMGVECKVRCLGAKKQNLFLDTEVLLIFECQGLESSNSSEMRENMMELLKRSILYVEPVDPVYWCGALRKCEGRILPCLQVRTSYKLFC